MDSLAPFEDDLAPVPNRIARIHHSFFQKNSLVPLGLRNDPLPSSWRSVKGKMVSTVMS